MKTWVIQDAVVLSGTTAVSSLTSVKLCRMLKNIMFLIRIILLSRSRHVTVPRDKIHAVWDLQHSIYARIFGNENIHASKFVHRCFLDMPEIKHVTHIVKCCALHVKTTESPHLGTESDSASNSQDASYNMGIYSMAAIVGLVHRASVAQDNFKPAMSKSYQDWWACMAQSGAAGSNLNDISEKKITYGTYNVHACTWSI